MNLRIWFLCKHTNYKTFVIMKKLFLLAAIAAGGLTAAAQAIETPKCTDNWSIGVHGGVTTPLNGEAFFGGMRPLIGVSVDKQITPTFGAGIEGQFGINTSTWDKRYHSSTAFDNSYVGAYGTVDLINLFKGYPGNVRPFSVEAVVGAGWGHYFQSNPIPDHNFFATKLGLNFNFNVSDDITIAVSPSFVWDMSDAHAEQSSASYDSNYATFNLQAGVIYHLGGRKFETVKPYSQTQIDVLNGQINDLRGQLEKAAAYNNSLATTNNELNAQLQECLNTPATVVTEVSETEYLNSVRFVFFKIGSSVITADQQPNVEMIAQFMKNNPESTVVVKGYASQDGNLEFNVKLAQSRADAVKNMLINKYKISADRITAEGEGIGHMFKEESWNRVSICTLQVNE